MALQVATQMEPLIIKATFVRFSEHTRHQLVTVLAWEMKITNLDHLRVPPYWRKVWCSQVFNRSTRKKPPFLGLSSPPSLRRYAVQNPTSSLVLLASTGGALTFCRASGVCEKHDMEKKKLHSKPRTFANRFAFCARRHADKLN